MRIGRSGVNVNPDEAVAAYLAGATVAEVAAHFGVDDETMRRFLHATGVPVRPTGSMLTSQRARALAIRGARLRRGYG